MIFTNQLGIEKGKTKLKDVTNKIESLFPFADYFISVKDDIYRKPMMGMYKQFITLNGDCDMFYVGDAAGRVGDHSNSDINFAYNSGIKFYTETQFFQGKNEDISVIIPKSHSKTNSITDLKKYYTNVVVIMQGLPACGKTTFIKDYLKYHNITDYLYLSNDTHTKSKLIKAYKKGLEEEKLIFIDNLNATKKNREDFIKLLPDYYNSIGIHIITDIDICLSLNKQRYYISNTDPEYKDEMRKKIPKVVFNTFNKRYEPMTVDEGFYKVYDYLPEIKLKYCFN